MTDEIEDKRPDPKPRKNAYLWQHYLIWNELVELRKKHVLRISSAEAGKSNFDAETERQFISKATLDILIDGGKHPITGEKVEGYRQSMIRYAELISVWPWASSIKGLGESGLTAQLLAQIDDIAKFANVSKLWRFAGMAVIDGKAERNKPGEKSHFNRTLKSLCWLIGEQFIRHQVTPYIFIYYEEKDRLREKFPEKIKVVDDKTGKSRWKYNDGHLHNMAKRKMMKIFLQHLWLKWRVAENLPISNPYVQDILGHSDIIPPPE